MNFYFYFFGKCPLQFPCFVSEKMSSSIPMLLAMLLAHVGNRSNRRSQMFSKTGVLKNFAIFTGKNLCWSLLLIKFQDWRPAFLFKKRFQHSCFSVNMAKFLRTAVLLKTCSLCLFEFFIWWWIIDIRPRNRKNFAVIERTSQKIDQNLFFAIWSFSEISKYFKLKREASSLKLNNFGFKF